MPELRGLLESALDASPQIISARLSLESTKASYIVSRAARLPYLSAGGSYDSASRRTTEPEPGPVTRSDSFSYNARVSMPLFHWGAIKRQTEISKLEVLFQEVNIAAAYQALAVSVRRQYLALVYQQMALRNARYTSKMADDYLALQKSKLEAGTLPAGAILTPELAAVEAKLVYEQAVEAQRFAAESLARLCGVAQIDLERLPQTMPEQKLSESVLTRYFNELAEATDLSKTAQAIQSEIRLEQDDLRYKIARANLLPKFGLGASYGVGNTTGVANNVVTVSATEDTSYGVSASWLIFDGLATRGQKLSILASKRLNERALKTYLEETQAELVNLEKQIEHATRRTELAQRRYDLARDAVRLTQDNFDAGVASQNAVTGVTSNAYQAELILADARQTELNLWTQYISTAGLDPVLENFSVINERISHGR